MPSIENTPRGTVVSIWGKAYIRGADGVWRPLKLGEVVKPGDAILTDQDSIVQMEPAPQRPALPEVDQAVSAVNRGTPDAAPAAGLAGGDGGGLQPGLRVERIAEGLNPAGVPTRLDATPVAGGIALAATAPEADAPARVGASSSNVSAVEQGGNVNLGLAAPTGGGNIVITVTQVPAVGSIVTAGGAAVAVGTVLAPSDLAGLVYQPPADYDGSAPVGAFGYSASNGSSSASGGTQISVTAVNDAPVATAGSASGLEDGAIGVNLAGSDVDGTIASVRVTGLPANGTLFLADGVTPVALGQALTQAEAAGLVFRPAADFNGSASLAFTVNDNRGAVSSPAAFALTVGAVNDAPVAAGDSVTTVGSAPVTLAVLANDGDVDGDVLVVTGASVNAALGSVVVNANGSLTFTAAPGVSGPVAIGYTIADPGGATASAVLTVNVAGSPSVTVDAPALTNDDTPLITGTSNLPPGSTVDVTVTDANGALQTFTATVQPDGSWSASVPAPLPDGSYSVSASVTAPGGASASANDGGSVDTTAPTLTVEAPALGNDATPTVSGSTDLPAGSTISLTVTGADGAVQTFTATVQPGGGFSADVPAPLAQGPFSVVAVGSDAAGNTGSASDSGTVDLTPPTLNVDVPALGNDPTPTIAGTSDLGAGSTVTLTVTDANGVVQTFTAAVQPGGGYSADVPAALAQGTYSVSASASDAAGNAASASDSGAIDSIAPTLTVDAPALTNDTTPTLTGTTDLPAGSTVTLTVTDSAGSIQMVLATVAAGGTYGVGVPTPLAQGAYTVSASASDVAGNAASANDSGAIDSIAPTLTVDAPALTNDTTPTIIGTTDLAAGSTVTLTITDSAGAVQTVDATVVAGGAYSADVPAPLAQGAFSVSAAAADAAGNTATAADSGAVDSIAPAASIAIDAVTGDDIVNAGEATGSVAISGSVGGDVLVGDSVTLTVDGNVYAGAVQSGGTFSIAVAGADLLAATAISAAVTTTDTAGNSTTANATRPYAVNSAPIAVADTAVVGEDAANVAGDATPGTPGQDSDADGDAVGVIGVAAGNQASVPGNVGTAVAGTYGSLTLAADGTWTYAPGANAQTLGAGQTGVDTFTYTISDGHGGSATTTITVNVAGANDAATASSGSGSVTEDSVLGASGSLTVSDPDAGQGGFVTQAGTVGSFGTFSIDAAGNWSFVLDNASATVQGLKSGDTLQQSFAVATLDGTPTTVAITLGGTDDGAVISGAASGSVAEDSTLVATGTLSVTDPDAGQAAFQPATVATANGTFAISAGGAWTYTLANAAVQSMTATETRTDTFTVLTVDGTSHAVAVTIDGTNDVPSVSASAASATEGDTTVTGSVSGSDPDVGETATLSYALTGAAPAGFTLNSDGSWSFDPTNAAYNSLAFGATRTLTIPFTATDAQGAVSTSANLTITVTGANDAPTVSASSASATEGDTTVTGSVTGSDPDVGETATLSYALTGAAPAGFTLNSDGSWSFDPTNAAYNGLAVGATQTLTIPFTATDTQSAVSTSANLTITVTGTNDVPTVSAGSAAVDEDNTIGGTLAGNDADSGETATLSYALTGAAPAGFALAADGSWTFDAADAAYRSLAAGQTQILTIAYTATDVNGVASAPADLTITVTGTNDAPVAVADIAATPINTALNNSVVLANDSDPDSGATLSVTGASVAAADGTVTVNPDGTLNFTPATNRSGPVTITYTLSDGAATTTGTLTVTVGDNTPPAGADKTITLAEDGSATLVAADFGFSDADTGQGLAAVRIDSLPGAGTLTLNGNPVAAGQVIAAASLGNLVFTPAADANGTAYASFTFSVQDSAGDFDATPNTIGFDVTAVADAATVGGITSADVAEDGTLVAGGQLTVTDPDAGEAAFVAQNVSNALGSFTVDAAGLWSYTLDNTAAQSLTAGQQVVQGFVVSTIDGTPVTVSVTITGTNDVPTVSASAASATEGGVAVTGNVSGSDADAGETATLSYALTGAAPAGFTLNSDGSWSFDPTNAAYNGLAFGATQTLTIPFTTTDAQGAVSAAANLTITVTGTNDVPLASNDGTVALPFVSVAEDSGASAPIAVLANDSDPDGDTLTVTAASSPGGTVTINPDDTLVFTPTADFSGATTISYTVSDGQGGTATATAFVNVTPINDAPVAADATVAATEDQVLNGTLPAATDVDGDAVTYALGTAAANGAVVVNADGTYSYTPAADFNGSDSFTYTVSDGNGGSNTYTVTVNVGAVNDAPVAADATVVATEDQTLNGTLPAVTDADGNAVTYALGTAAANGAVVVNADGTYSYTPNADFNGSDSFTYTVSDGNGGSNTYTVTVNVGAVNDAPVAADAIVAATEDQTLNGTLPAATDADGDAVTYALGTVAANGTVSVNTNGTYSYVPNANFNGSDSFTYTISDGNGGSSTYTVSVTIDPVNDAPTAAAVSVSTTEDVALNGTLPTAADLDGDTVTYALGAGAANGTVSVNSNGAYSYTPNANFSGSDSFTYTVSDGNGGSNTYTVTVNVGAVNDAPVNTVPASIAVTEDIASALTGISIADVDAGGSAVTVTLSVPAGTLAATSGGGVAVGGTSSALTLTGTVAAINSFIAASNVSYTTAANADGSVTLSVATSDNGNTGSGGTLGDTDAVTLSITPVNDAPQTGDASASGAEDPAARIQVTLAGGDIDGTVAGFTITGLPANGTLYAAASGGSPLAVGAVVSGPVYFVPSANFNGTTSFQYAATDNGGATDASPATATITISAVNDAPVNTLSGSISATEDTTTAITGLSVADVDAGSGSITVTLSVTNGTLTVSGGSATIAGSGTASVTLTGTLAAINATLAASVAYLPSANFNGSATLTMVTNDNGNTGGAALGDSDSLVFNVAAVNDAPASVADSIARVEGGSTSGFLNVLANDSDVEGSALTVAQVATSAGGSALAVNGISTLTTALGGTVIMNADGSFRYVAPAVAHNAGNTPVADSFAYRASDGTDLGAWTAVTLNLSDTTPTAANDSANVVFNGSVSGNLLINDSSVDALRVSSFSFGSTTVTVPSGGSNAIDTAGGLLTVNADGSWTYTSQLPNIKVLTGSSLATWEASTNLYGYTSGSAVNGSGNLVLGNLTTTLQGNATFVNGAKNGIGVSGGGATLGNGETLVVDMTETTTFVTIGIAQLNTNQSPSNAVWKAFAADGTLVASGTFAGAVSVSSGTEYTLDISHATPFQYLTLEWTNTSNGFVLSSLDLTRNPSNYVETFSYTATDADGDSASASFTVTPASSSSSGSTTLTGTAGDDTYAGTAAAETFNAGSGHDVLRAGGGNDTLNGSDGLDYLDGGAGNDVVNGGSGNDILIGGAGNDTLTGGSGADVFRWSLADKGTTATPAADTIVSFDSASAASGGDVLDLRDLLQGETTQASLDAYLDLSIAGGTTVINIKSSGSGSADQTLTLAGVTLDTALGLSAGATDAQLIAELINRGKLLTDVPG